MESSGVFRVFGCWFLRGGLDNLLSAENNTDSLMHPALVLLMIIGQNEADKNAQLYFLINSQNVFNT